MRFLDLTPVSLAPVLFALTLSGCALLQPVAAPAPVVVPEALPASTNPLTTLGEGVSVSALPTASAEETAAALDAAPEVGERLLGTVSVALGSPTEQGFWLKTNLVSVAVPGRVETLDGQTLDVELQPTDGGALLSFAAFRTLGLPLTDLPEVKVFAK